METLLVVAFGLFVVFVIGCAVGLKEQSQLVPTKKQYKVKVKPTCPAPKISQECLLTKIRIVKTYTNNGDYVEALLLLEELDVILSSILSITNSNTDVIPVNSAELKE